MSLLILCILLCTIGISALCWYWGVTLARQYKDKHGDQHLMANEYFLPIVLPAVVCVIGMVLMFMTYKSIKYTKSGCDVADSIFDMYKMGQSSKQSNNLALLDKLAEKCESWMGMQPKSTKAQYDQLKAGGKPESNYMATNVCTNSVRIAKMRNGMCSSKWAIS